MKHTILGWVAVAVCAETMSAFAGGDLHRKTKPIAKTDNAPAEVQSAPLFRKTTAIIGDSYVYNHHRPIEETWHYRLAEKYQMDYYNYGRNGNSLVLARGPKQGHPIARRYVGMHTPADYVVVVAGHNDAYVITTNAAKIAEFRTGLTNLVANLRVKYPAAQIVFVSPWNVKTKSGFEPVLTAYRELLPSLGVNFYDAAANSGLDPHDKDGDKAALWQSPTDTAHLSYAGHTLMLEKMEPFFLSLAPVASGETPLPSVREPLKIALTFDDGFAHHLTLVAPLLEKYGYKGAFSINTDSIGVREGRMTWDDVRELKSRGHDIFSHSCSHPNLTKLVKEGQRDEARRQIVESAAKIKEETGEAPKVFCFPFNAERHVTGMVRETGMVPMQARRVNFGDGTWKGGKADVDAHIDRLRAEGRKADALMIHGIGRETGAHRPFKDAAHFERFLQTLKAREAAGDILVVPYMEIAETVAPK